MELHTTPTPPPPLPQALTNMLNHQCVVLNENSHTIIYDIRGNIKKSITKLVTSVLLTVSE